jgi:hypothetical protein
LFFAPCQGKARWKSSNHEQEYCLAWKSKTESPGFM